MRMRSHSSAPLKDAETSESLRFLFIYDLLIKSIKGASVMTNIAILGFGVVGGGVADVIATNNETIARKTGEHT